MTVHRIVQNFLQVVPVHGIRRTLNPATRFSSKRWSYLNAHQWFDYYYRCLGPLPGWHFPSVRSVRNRPDFTNRPLVFTDQLMNRAMVEELCRRGTVTMIERSSYRLVPFGFSEGEADGEEGGAAEAAWGAPRWTR